MTADPGVAGSSPLTPADRHKASAWFIVEGALLIVLGVLAAALPGLAGFAGAAVFGWVLVFSGVFGLASLFGARRHVHVALGVASGLVALVVGLLIVWRPLVGAVTLAILLGVYLLIDGGSVIGMALDQRRRGGRRWGWLLASGVLDLGLALVVLMLRPIGDTVLLGFVIAIDLVVAGIALVGVGLGARQKPI
jgi:uncharacterized membrane protein HdeD (DUF308 family)